MTTPRTPRPVRSYVRREWPLLVDLATTALLAVFGRGWLAELHRPAWFAALLGWLYVAMLMSASAVVRHANGLALRLKEPLGTLVLTLSLSGMGIMMIAAVMYAGQGHSALARDTMFAIVMILLNGVVGACLLLGGLRHHEQTFDLYRARAFLAVLMTLTVFGLVLLAFTVSSTGTSLAPRHTALLIAMSVGLYAIFVAIQTLRHRDDFVGHGAAATNGRDNARTHHALRLHSAGYHGLLLLAYVLPLVLLANQIAVPVHYGMSVLGVPAALGGLLVAVLILSPEALAAIRAALANQLQRSMDLALRTPLSSISLTIPAVLGIGFLANRTIVLGLGPAAMTLLWLTLGVSMLTFARERPSALLGAVHAILFLVYLTLIFMK